MPDGESSPFVLPVVVITGVSVEFHPASGIMRSAYAGVLPTASNDHAARVSPSTAPAAASVLVQEGLLVALKVVLEVTVALKVVLEVTEPVHDE